MSGTLGPVRCVLSKNRGPTDGHGVYATSERNRGYGIGAMIINLSGHQ